MRTGLPLVVAFLLALLLSASALASETKDLDALLEQCKEAYSAGDYQTAIARCRQGLKRAQDRGLDGRAAEFSSKIGLVYETLHQYEQAREFHLKALELDRKTGSRFGEAEDLANIALACEKMWRLEEALQYYAKSRDIFHEENDTLTEAKVQMSMAYIYYELADYGKVLELSEASSDVFRTSGNKDALTSVLSLMGRTHHQLNQYRKALNFHNEALKLDRDVGDRAGEAAQLNNIGQVYHVMNQKDKALEFYEKSRLINHEVKDEYGEAKIVSNIGNLFSDMGQHEKAVQMQKEGLEIFISINDAHGAARQLANIGIEYKKSKTYGQSQKYYQKALPLFIQIDTPEDIVRIYSQFADIYAKKQNPSASVFFGKLSVNTVQAMRGRLMGTDDSMQNAFIKSKCSVYEGLFCSLRKFGREQEAQQVLDLLEVQESKDDMADTHEVQLASIPFTPAEQPWAERFEALRQEIASKACWTADVDEAPAAEAGQDNADGCADLRARFNAFMDEVEAGLSAQKS